jgi:lipoic acid synthetase
MVGLGETDEEVTQTLRLLKDANVDLITIGQYLAPSSKHLSVDRFPQPEQYDIWAKQAISMGFSGIASGPLVRSSFKAGLLLRKSQDPQNSESMPGAYVYVNDLQDIHTTSLKADID